MKTISKVYSLACRGALKLQRSAGQELELLKISKCIGLLRERGLYLYLSNAAGKEFDIPPLLAGAYYALYRANTTENMAEIGGFIARIIAVYEKEGKEYPGGKLDLKRAMDQYNSAISQLDPKKMEVLESAYLIAAVRDNLEVESHREIANRYMAIIELLNRIAVDDIRQASLAVVQTAQDLWPGGNPTLLLYDKKGEKEYLVPIAVALPESVISIGETVMNKKLGEYRIEIVPESQNPYVQAFLHGELRIETNISRERHRDVCAGFIDEPVTGIKDRLFYGISYPGKNNTMITVPLNVADPLSGERRTIALFAVMKKGVFSKEDMRLGKAFVKASARMLAQIQWREGLRNAQEKLVQHERMAAMGELAANISHASKNSLRIAGALIDKIGKIGLRKEILIEILRLKSSIETLSGQDLSILSKLDLENSTLTRALSKELLENETIVRGMLSFAREERGERKNISLAAFIKEREVGFRIQAEKAGVSFYSVYRIEDKDGVLASELDIGDIFKNLIGNAIEALERTSKHEKIIRLSIVRMPNNPETISIKVADNGPGIQAQNLGGVFSESRRGKSAHGTGLGLPEVKKKVERNGGEISVTSKEGEGTIFEIRFPWTAASSAWMTGKKKPVISRAAAEKIEVVFADDSTANRELTHQELSGMGFPVSSFTSAEEAFSAIIEGRAFPDLVIVDQDFGKGKTQGHALLRNLAEFYQSEGRKLPRFAIFSGDIPPARGEVAETVKKFNIKWIAKGSDVEDFRGEVSEAAEGVIENVSSYYPSTYLEDNSFRMFAKGICHKMNNGLQVLGYLQFEEPDVQEARKGFARYFGSLERLLEFARSAGKYKKMPMEEIANMQEYSSNEIMKDESAISGWDKLDDPERYKIAIVIQKYFDRVSAPAREIMDLLDKGSIDNAGIQKVNALADKIKQLNDIFGLKVAEGEELAQFYQLLEMI